MLSHKENKENSCYVVIQLLWQEQWWWWEWEGSGSAAFKSYHIGDHVNLVQLPLKVFWYILNILKK